MLHSFESQYAPIEENEGGDDGDRYAMEMLDAFRKLSRWPSEDKMTIRFGRLSDVNELSTTIR